MHIQGCGEGTANVNLVQVTTLPGLNGKARRDMTGPCLLFEPNH